MAQIGNIPQFAPIKLPYNLHVSVIHTAKAHNLSVNAFITQAVAAYLKAKGAEVPDCSPSARPFGRQPSAAKKEIENQNGGGGGWGGGTSSPANPLPPFKGDPPLLPVADFWGWKDIVRATPEVFREETKHVVGWPVGFEDWEEGEKVDWLERWWPRGEE